MHSMYTVSKYDNSAEVPSLLLLSCESVHNLEVMCATSLYIKRCICELLWLINYAARL